MMVAGNWSQIHDNLEEMKMLGKQHDRNIVSTSDSSRIVTKSTFFFFIDTNEIKELTELDIE